MKKLFALPLMLLCFMATAQSPAINCTNADELNAQLEKIREADQSVRKELFEVLNTSKDPDKLKELALKIDSTNRANEKYVAELFETCGWPNNLSATANKALFLVVDHAKLEYQLKYAPLLKEQSDKGVIPQADYFTLDDRIRMHQGQKQRYGTQTVTNTSRTKTYVWPVEDADTLNERRQEVGLPTMEQYQEIVKNFTKIDVVWDKTLSIETVQELKKE